MRVAEIHNDIADRIIIESERAPSRSGSETDLYDDSISAVRKLFGSPAFITGGQVSRLALELNPTLSYSDATSVHTMVTDSSSVFCYTQILMTSTHYMPSINMTAIRSRDTSARIHNTYITHTYIMPGYI